MRSLFDDAFERPWRHGRSLPPSSVTWPDELPDEDAPPWVCLSRPGAPVVIRSYDFSSRTCDVIARHGRWLLESALVPRSQFYGDEIHFGWDIPVGDVSPGWCIVYYGNALWFPQRVLRVDVISDDWQRVWTLGDAMTRDVWHTENGDVALEDEYESRDNGYTSGWSFDEKSEPLWDGGPFYPLQSEPLDEDVRRFILDKFDIAGECPKCGQFGKMVVYGLPSQPLEPHFIVGGCTGFEGIDGKYGCDCGHRWSVDDQGRAVEGRLAAASACEAGTEHSGTRLNYDLDDEYPYGEATQTDFDDYCVELLDLACEVRGVSTEGEDGPPDYPVDLLVHYLGDTFLPEPPDPYDQPGVGY